MIMLMKCCNSYIIEPTLMMSSTYDEPFGKGGSKIFVTQKG